MPKKRSFKCGGRPPAPRRRLTAEFLAALSLTPFRNSRKLGFAMGVNTSICHRMRVGRLFPCGPVKVERLRDLALRIGYRGPVIDGEQTFSVTEVRAHDDGVVERLEHRADGDKWVTR